jgi:diguanylate cyclase (GGDEF)-like protein
MPAVVEEARCLSICVVDDDPVQSERLQVLLKDENFDNVCAVASVQELLEQLRERNRNKIDGIGLVLLSDSLKDTNVYDVCRLLSAHTESGNVAVIILSDSYAKDQVNIIEKSREAGALDALSRKVGVAELIPRVDMALNLQKERCLRKMREESWETELSERKVMEARLKYLVAHDDLTGLANRRRLEQALELAVIRARNFHRVNALLYLDLDQFKVINDAEGHDVGDRMLMEVANKLRSYVKPGQLVARIGSDEFAILLEHVTESDAMDFAELLRKTLSEATFSMGSVSYHIGTSVGVVLNTPEEEVSVSKLLARADQACYIAKTQGRNTVYKFSGDDEGLRELRSDARWVPVIRNALADDKFFIVFQPIMNLHTRKITHYEALIRMRGNDGEIYTPVDFIPVAERMGLIHQIDLWVVEHALDFLSSLPQDKGNVSISINLSGHAFQDLSLLPLIKQKLELTWISASRLTFEITETAAITNFSETRDMVARLRALGCRFALDDFGSGFCSFSYIKNYPVDLLKIDGSFIVNLINDETDQLLVKSMIEVAHSLGKKVIAEYVENREIMDKLVEFGVDYVQGYFIGMPNVELVDEDFVDPSEHQGNIQNDSSRDTEFEAFVEKLTQDEGYPEE